MNLIATLGPPGTFTDLASHRFLEESSMTSEIRYYDSIKLALDAVGRECEVAVIPIENFSEGFIPFVLDTLAKRNLFIIHEVLLPVRFSFVGNRSNIEDVTKVFTQFVTKGQCSEFLSTLGCFSEVTTQSNIESLESIRCESSGAGAIVPAHAAAQGEFPLVIENVNDFPDNQTRFVAVSAAPARSLPRYPDACKTSLVVYGDRDYPGLLGDILSPFSTRKLNITSLISRPNARCFGQYNFFIDVAGHESTAELKEAIREVGEKCPICSLGSYWAAALHNR